jgi:calcium-dependent protein kinase
MHPWIQDQGLVSYDKEFAGVVINDLKNFRAREKIKQATCSFIAAQMISKKEKEALASVFKLIDTNGDGKLSKEEVQMGFEKHFGIPMTKEKVEELFSNVDMDKSGFIDFSEFIVGCTSEKNIYEDTKIRAAFRMFDKDDSGQIS